MPGSVFLDTDVLVYAIESAGPDSRKSSTALVIPPEGTGARSPDDLQAERPQRGVIRDQGGALDGAMRGEHAVEGIAVGLRPPACALRVLHRDGERAEAGLLHPTGDVLDEDLGRRQPSQAVLRSDLPGARARDEDGVGRIRNDAPRDLREPRRSL